jgi:hypothetical protein
MAEKPVQTKWGPMTRAQMESLKTALDGQDRDATINWEGQEVLVSFGLYLVEFVESEFAKRNTRGL